MEATLGSGSSKSEHESPSTPSAVIRVLIVNDERATCTLLARMLGKGGVLSEAAASAENSPSFLEKESADSVVPNLQTTGVSGMEFPAEGRQRHRKLTFLMFGAGLFLRLTSRNPRRTSGLTLLLACLPRNFRRSLFPGVGKQLCQNGELAGWDIHKR